MAGVGQRHRLRREGEVPAVGSALEEHVVVAGAPDPVYMPRRVQGGAVQPQRDACPVLVGVEVHSVYALQQPHMHPVGEKLCLRRPELVVLLLLPGAEDGGEGAGFLVSTCRNYVFKV